MAIVRVTGGGGLERRVGLKAAKKAAKKGAKKAAKKGAKYAIEKHAARKGAIEKQAGKKVAGKAAGIAAKKVAKKAAKQAAKHSGKQPVSLRERGDAGGLDVAFHHLQRAIAVISLVEQGDLVELLEVGLRLYRRATEVEVDARLIKQALHVAEALEHLGMAGLYAARMEFRVEGLTEPEDGMEMRLDVLRGRLERLGRPTRDEAALLMGVAWELLRRADGAGDDAHLEWELALAAEGLCVALEAGF